MQPEGITLGIFLAMAVSAPDFAQAAMTKIGFPSPAIAPTHAAANAALEAFRQGLADLGYVYGRDFTIEARRGSGRDDQLPVLAAELVGQKVDILAGRYESEAKRDYQRRQVDLPRCGACEGPPSRLSGGNNPGSRRAA